MPEGLSLALQVPGIAWVPIAAFISGVVYGFAGFGAALVFVPLAVAFVSPLLIVPAFQLSALMSLFTLFPKAARRADWRTSSILVGFSILSAPFGVYMLLTFSENFLQWCVSIIVIVTLTALLFGWRYQTSPSNVTTASIGLAAGAMGGSTGLNGPIVILFRLGGQDSAETTRANMLVFLTLNSLATIPIMVWQGAMTVEAFWIGLVLLPSYGIGNLIGQALFKPAQEGIYRNVAYALIGLSALIGLPIW